MKIYITLLLFLLLLFCNKTTQLDIDEKLAKKKQYVHSSNKEFQSAFPYREHIDTLKRGYLLYQRHCEKCHKFNAEQSIAPILFDNHWLTGARERTVFNIIQNGTKLLKIKERYNGEEMPPFRYIINKTDIRAIVAWLISKNPSIRP